MTTLAAALAAPLDFPAANGCDGARATIAMVGDVMQHGEQLKASQQRGHGHSWRGVFEPVAPLIRSADLAIANLETPVDAAQPYAGYPLFNAPEALLVALRDAGFDMLQTANNHCLDRGRAGALATIEAVERHGFDAVGTWPDAVARVDPWRIRTLPDGTRVALLAYTYGTNGEPMPYGEPWLVNWLDDGQMQRDVERARHVADLIVVGLHWGAEYRHHPTEAQRAIARSLVEAGADVVLGSHPHVLQPAEVITVDELDGPRDALVLYSLGNFVSNQRTFPRDGGVVVRVDITTCGRARITDARFTPVWVDDRVRGHAPKVFRVVPTPPPDAACEHLELTDADCARMATFRDHAATLLPAEQFDWGLPDGSSVWPTPSLLATQAEP